MASLHLALFLETTGCHYAGWRMPLSGPVPHPADFTHLKALAVKAEQAKFDLVFMADKLSVDDIYGNHFSEAVTHRVTERPDPFAVLSALSAVTEKIGLAGTISSSFASPFAAARTLSTLDHLSLGRVGWNVVTSTSGSEAKNFGVPLLSHDQRYLKADAFIDAVFRLWDSWETDAIIADREKGIYADASKIHYADISNQWFNVQGPLNLSRAPQGRPVTIQAGGSGAFTELAAQRADAIFASEKPSLVAAQTYYTNIKAKVVKYGRPADSLKVLPGLQPVIGETQKEADELLSELTLLHHPLATLTHLSNTMDYDWSQHGLDEAMPDILTHLSRRERFAPMLNHAREQGMTLRQFTKWIARSGFIVAGTPEDIAERIALWYQQRAVDGFVIMPPWPGAANMFFDKVVPLLQERGVFREEYSSETLRGHLKLN